jgi:hypothetical protein
MRQQQKNNMKTLLNVIVAVIVLGSNAANAQTAYEKQMFTRCKDSFKRLFKTDLLPTNLKEVNNATMGKFASLLTQESLANLPCGLKDVVTPHPGVINPTPVGVEITGTKLFGDSRVMYVPTNPTSRCTPDSPGIFVFGGGAAKGCKEITICEGRKEKKETDCQCDCIFNCGNPHSCTDCPK